MNYGNAKNLSNGTANATCAACGDLIDKHTISVIKSSEETDKLAHKLQKALDGVYETALLKGYAVPQVTMVGAAIAKVGSSVIKVVGLSGANAEGILKHIPSLGGDVIVVSANVASFKTVSGRSINPAPAPAPGGYNYQVGSCAAQKILMEIIRRANPSGKPRLAITEINMSEIFWKTNSQMSNWSSGEIVESCDTCKRIVPMMLCDKME